MIDKYHSTFGRYVDKLNIMRDLFPSGQGDMRTFGEKYVNSRKAKSRRRKNKKRK